MNTRIIATLLVVGLAAGSIQIAGDNDPFLLRAVGSFLRFASLFWVIGCVYEVSEKDIKK